MLNSKDYFNKYINTIDILKKKALMSSFRHQHAAALMDGDKEVCISYNKRQSELNTIHAEMDVVFSGKKLDSIRKMDVIVIRTKNNNLLNSRPCNNCIDKMVQIGINKVFYSNEYGEIMCEYVKNMEKIHFCSRDRNSK